MTVNEVKKTLEEIPRREQLIATLRRSINDELIKMGGVGSVDYSKPPVQGSGENTVEARYSKHADKVGLLQTELMRILELQRRDQEDIRNRLALLNCEEYAVIRYRFMLGLTVYKTAALIHSSERRVHYIQHAALRKMADE